jgi:hypothetical protein
MAQDMMTFDDMGTNEPVSEIQRRKQQLQGNAQQFAKESQQVTGREEQTLRSQAAMTGMQDQMSQMKQAMKYQQTNFDEGLKQQRELAALDGQAKAQLFDAQIQFNRDAQGRKLMNERQLLDWMVNKSAGEEDFKNYQQRTEQLHARKLQMLQVAQAKIKQAESQLYQMTSGQLDKETKIALTNAKMQADKKIAKAKQDAANKNSIITGAFTVAGAVIGGIFGNAPGAVAGASIGSGAGQAVSGAAG